MADRLSANQKLQRLLDNTVLNIVTAVTLASGRRLDPATIEAVRGALDPALRAARALGALQPGYPARDDSTDEFALDNVGNGISAPSVHDTQPGYKTARSKKLPKP